jgi:peptidoglycan/xylan/chitin deacetylase (PgdA/CDA1 family)
MKSWFVPLVGLLVLLFACSHAVAPTATPAPHSSADQLARNSLPPQAGTAPDIEGHVRAISIDHGSRNTRTVALTFDADMTPSMLAELKSGDVSSWYNRGVIDELRRTNTPATIFLTGLWTKTYPQAVKSFAADPLFELANHSWDHSSFEPNCYGLPSVSSASQKEAEVTQAADEIDRVAGRRPVFFRFPGGCHDNADLRIVANEGEQVVGWDVVSGDAFQPNPDPIVQAVMRGVRPGSIVIMHLHGGPNAPATDEALQRIIPALKKEGYRFVTLSELLNR